MMKNSNKKAGDWGALKNKPQNQIYFKDGGKVKVTAGGEKHVIYKKTTKRGEGKVGNVMVNHPTKDKGVWDTIDLTKKSGAKTIKQGIASTKKWHKENPYNDMKKQTGNMVKKYQRGGKTATIPSQQPGTISVGNSTAYRDSLSEEELAQLDKENAAFLSRNDAVLKDKVKTRANGKRVAVQKIRKNGDIIRTKQVYNPKKEELTTKTKSYDPNNRRYTLNKTKSSVSTKPTPFYPSPTPSPSRIKSRPAEPTNAKPTQRAVPLEGGKKNGGSVKKYQKGGMITQMRRKNLANRYNKLSDKLIAHKNRPINPILMSEDYYFSDDPAKVKAYDAAEKADNKATKKFLRTADKKGRVTSKMDKIDIRNSFKQMGGNSPKVKTRTVTTNPGGYSKTITKTKTVDRQGKQGTVSTTKTIPTIKGVASDYASGVRKSVYGFKEAVDNKRALIKKRRDEKMEIPNKINSLRQDRKAARPILNSTKGGTMKKGGTIKKKK